MVNADWTEAKSYRKEGCGDVYVVPLTLEL